jgi:hypothetical protein
MTGSTERVLQAPLITCSEPSGRRRPKRRRNGSRIVAGSARGRSDKNGYAGGKRESRSIPHSRVALLQGRLARWRARCPRAARPYNLALGAFLFASPWLVASTNGPMGEEAWVGGSLIILISVASLVAFAKWEEWSERARVGPFAGHLPVGAGVSQCDGDEDQCRHRTVGSLFRRARALPRLRFSAAADTVVAIELRLTRIGRG